METVRVERPTDATPPGPRRRRSQKYYANNTTPKTRRKVGRRSHVGDTSSKNSDDEWLSEPSCDHEFVSEGESTGTSQDGNAGGRNKRRENYSGHGSVAKQTRLRKSPKTKRSATSSVPNNTLVIRSPSQSFWSKLVDDLWNVIVFALKLPRILYPLWKWLVVLYILWMLTSHAAVFVYRSAKDALAPICSIPVIGPQIPFCSINADLTERTLNASKMAASQSELATVMDHAGQNYDLARDMIGHEFAVRDLRIRVAASSLSRRDELTRELETLIRVTKDAAKGMSRFTAKVSKTVDTVHAFDAYAAKTLEGIISQREYTPSLPARFLDALNPLGAFTGSNADSSETQVKALFLSTAARLSSRVTPLIDESFRLETSLDLIQETLDRIQELAVDETGEAPRMHVLAALWMRLARADDYEAYRAHAGLLMDLMRFYDASKEVMRLTRAALNRVGSELDEFRDDLASPGLVLADAPLEVVIAEFRNSGQRLEAGRLALRQIEQSQSHGSGNGYGYEP